MARPPRRSAAIATMALSSAKRPMAPSQSAHIRLVNLDLASEPISARSHHRPAKLVQPSPGRLVAAQAEYPLQAKGADALLLVGHVSGGGEPGPERTPRVLEDRPRGDRGLSGSLRGRLLLAGQVKDIRLGVDQPFIRRLPVRASSRHSRRRQIHPDSRRQVESASSASRPSRPNLGSCLVSMTVIRVPLQWTGLEPGSSATAAGRPHGAGHREAHRKSPTETSRGTAPPPFHRTPSRSDSHAAR